MQMRIQNAYLDNSLDYDFSNKVGYGNCVGHLISFCIMCEICYVICIIVCDFFSNDELAKAQFERNVLIVTHV